MNKLLSKKYLIIPSIFFAIISFLYVFNISIADEYISADFKIVDEASTYGGGYSASSDYTMESALGYANSSTSSASSYNLNPFFVNYPIVSIPIVLSTVGSSQVGLSWTASVGQLGWNVSGYNVGVSTVPGGPYTFSSSLGNVLSSTRTGLTNGTTYYFVIRVEDAFGNIVATSSEVSATPVASVTPPSGGGGGWLPPIIIPPQVVPIATTTIPTKPICKAYMAKSIKLGAANDPAEVKKLQTFLKNYEGFTTLSVTGFYDQSSYNAVKKFQAKYTSDILLPWGDTVPTGYVFTQTLKKINEIYCQKTSEAMIEPVQVATTTIPTKPICKAYMAKSIKLGAANDPAEVKKLQTFLKNYEGFTTLSVTGFYDQSSYNAVKKFQAKYTSDILLPWGDTVPTGYVFTQTLKKINEIYCQKTSEAMIEETFVPVTPIRISNMKLSIVSIIRDIASPVNWVPSLIENLAEEKNAIVLAVADFIKTIVKLSFGFFQQLFK